MFMVFYGIKSAKLKKYINNLIELKSQNKIYEIYCKKPKFKYKILDFYIVLL